ncbi:methyltransferase domain-containing protein [Roseiconus nitratireducens]|uniref:Methyltransferase domain-containing protein n=1 Tax=Roseiconus nitratireducens TaxID=2605748 RepID=A0A5M6D6Q9_9BACT|nr:methyltransferase domain-containing protein [Roseiconus nitratireducens]KAA5543033.1 methyltransferase domain-containing protein [Roseiconus nitratireducens]
MTANPTRQFYDRISHAYDLIADGGEHVAREKGLEMLGVRPGESVLEIGYGTGHSLVALAQAVGPDGRVAGVDISSGMRDVAAKRVRYEGVEDRVELLVESVPPIPFPDDQFDVVTMSFTLELFDLEAIPAVLAECRRVLKPNGRLGVVSMATVSDGQSESLLEKTYVWMHAHFPHIVDCQPIPLEKLLGDAGFALQKQERIELFTMPIAIVVAGLSE